ncbi:MAG: DUF1501 domain-containing protein [Planctomycetes bacterium]|nr:DUF1501 domain-containing protein [Planctomycetota bacterium]
MLQPLTRRQALKTTAAGFGYLALAGMLGAQQQRAATVREPGPLAPRAPHFPVKAKRIIFCFMEGAMSQMDTFEYKPYLQNHDGQVATGGAILTASKFRFARHGHTGTWVSNLLPNFARHADKFCFLRGLHTDTPAHPQAVIQLHTGTAIAQFTRPSMGAWLLYGLGTENQDLPGYITINPSPNFGGAINFGTAFMPAHFQGTRVSDTGVIPNLRPSTPMSLQRRQLELIQEMNRDLARSPGAPNAVEGVIQSYELAFRMQDRVPELLNLAREPQAVLDMYGVQDGPQGSFARQCLMARRLSEAGVRFVEITQSGWDHHNNLHNGLISQSSKIDRPMAALLTDLEQRGLLDETLVLFGSEFGRMPTAQGPDGRDHNITGYPMILVGAGVKAGYSYGATDEIGRHAIAGRMHMNDLHATLLSLMGLDHEQLTYRYAGRDFRLTDVAGRVVTEIMD